MDPITDEVQHTVVMSKLQLPSGGFFSTALGVEMRSGGRPSYSVTSGALLYSPPTALGSVVSGIGEGEDKPFRGSRLNRLYLRIVLGASLWGGAPDPSATAAGAGASITSAIGVELRLPTGYSCVTATSASPEDLELFFSARASAPQGRGDVALDAAADGFWLYSGQTCMYALRPYGVIYAGSAIIIRLDVNNPIFALPRTDSRNVWSLRLRGAAAPLVADSTEAAAVKSGGLSAFVDAEEFLRKNSPVLGILTGTSLTPTLFGAGEDGNWLSVFFTAEQSVPGEGALLDLLLPSGFGFMPSCLTQPLPSYHYASLSSRRTGQTLPTEELLVARCTASLPRTDSMGQSLADRSSTLLNLATVMLPNTARILGGVTYGFQIQVFNAEDYSESQHDSFSLTTKSADGGSVDSTFETIRFLASEGEGPGKSFSVYKYPMAPGTFVLSLDNMLPYSETGMRTRMVLFPLRIPFDSLDEVEWRLIAPHGYEWDFKLDEFLYRREDILGVTADLPIARKPLPPALPPKNVLTFSGNFEGSWDRLQMYGLIARIRVPDATPRSSSNAFFVEFGFSSRDGLQGRLAAASFAAPKVRALVSSLVDYLMTSLAGQPNRLLVRFEAITSLPLGGGFTLDAPSGYVFEESCAVLASPARRAPYQDLANIPATLLCSSTLPYTTDRPLVTISVLSGEVLAGAYEFAMDVQNPMTPSAAGALVWSLSSWTNLGLKEIGDLTAIIDSFPVETPMQFGQLVGSSFGVNYALTGRDDHPGQLSNVILAFELTSTPELTEDSPLVVKAPPGYSFVPLCSVVLADDVGNGAESVFGRDTPFPTIFAQFEASAAVASCRGSSDGKAELLIGPGLQNARRYAFRIEVINPQVTPEQNRWSISYAGQSTEPFSGYRLWRLTEVSVSASHAARSTSAEETKNHVEIYFRPTNTVTAAGFLALAAPFGFRVPTVCEATLRRLDALGNLVATLQGVNCFGTPNPSNTAEIHVNDSSTQIAALEMHTLDILVLNPSVIPLEPGTWTLQTYSTKQPDYSRLLDIGEGASFILTEVFHTLEITYPTFVGLLVDELELRMQVVLPNAVELGDVLQISGPEGYNFKATDEASDIYETFGECNGFSLSSPADLPQPECHLNVVRFSFLTTGLPLLDDLTRVERLTALIDFKVSSVYPTRTLTLAATVFYGEHKRGELLLASKTVQGQLVTPRLQGLSVERMDAMIAVSSESSLRISFTPSQAAQALSITTEVKEADASQAEKLHFDLSSAQVSATEDGEALPLTIVSQSSVLVLQLALQPARSYVVTLRDTVNPENPGTAMWSLTTYVTSPTAADGSWITDQNRRDNSRNFAGPSTVVRLELDESSFLQDPFFDIANTEFRISFTAYPKAVAAGSFLVLLAPLSYEFLDKTFSPGSGFPLISGQVFATNVPEARARYVINILTQILSGQTVRFQVRLRTPDMPADLAVWSVTHQRSWLLLACSDPNCLVPSASNDDLFPGFELKASFGATELLPEANGVSPQTRVSVTLTINPKTTPSSLVAAGSVNVRLLAPLGFDFAVGCLAVTPNPSFEACFGFGRTAVLTARGAELSAGLQSVALLVTNAAMTPSAGAGGFGNEWLLESFIDMPVDEVVKAPNDAARQRSQVPGYEIRELLQATVGANTQRGSVTTVFVWFISTNFLDVGGSIQLHAPPTYELRCTPRVQYISLPAGTCELIKGVTATTGDVYHHYLSLDLTLPGQQVYPNTAYEFGVSAVNPSTPSDPNYWGIVLLKPGNEVVDATRTLPGYGLTDFHLVVQPPLASSTRPAVVNRVRLLLTFQRRIAPGEVGHITIRAPSTSKVLCQQFRDVSGGGNMGRMLPVSSTFGVYGSHTCQLQNSLTLHLDESRAILSGSYTLELGILNPGIRAAKDYWNVDFLPVVDGSSPVNGSNASTVVTSWRNAPAILSLRTSGFGVSKPFVGPEIQPIALDVGVSRACRVASLGPLLALHALRVALAVG
eukprot:TRINITY_DN39331_c0_g1_i1.p1 TRINITY_DN39331_c0_g1~~TRINITY_DN39331_c0_g1_i1.p1  ORF type:complete len:2141 (-),score=384.05 TRINITY_DN39331_c0_g1_i1:55-6009(-)